MTIDKFFAAARSVSNEVKFFHAAQLRDFRSYVKAGRILTRSELFDLNAEQYTPFHSDAFDARQGCAGDVFGNLVDGARFSSNGRALPNVYGPITVVFPFQAVLHGAGTEIFVRRGGIWSADAVSSKPVEDCAALLALFKGRDGGQEFQLRNGSLKIIDLAYVLVDPIVVYGTRLADLVSATLMPSFPNGLGGRIIERTLRPEWLTRYVVLVEWASHAPTNRGTPNSLPPNLHSWFDDLKGTKKTANLARFADYLSHGTLSAMQYISGHLTVSNETALPVYAADGNEVGAYDAHELSDLELAERDVRMKDVELAETRLARAWTWGRRVDQENAWDDYVHTLDLLNDWIGDMRSRIESDAEALHMYDPQAHDHEPFQSLTAWADQFVSLDVPEIDLPDDEIPKVKWEHVRDFPQYS